MKLELWRCREDMRLAQMSKLKWKVKGDRNFTFFRACLVNKRRKYIWDMRAKDGVVFELPEAIHQGAMDYFSNFLQADPARDLPLFNLASYLQRGECPYLLYSFYG